MDRTLYDEYNQAYTSGAYGEKLDEISNAYENGYRQGKFEGRQTGKWVCEPHPNWSKWGIHIAKCSECGFSGGTGKWNFCPNCGTDMRGEE